jgi:hypothetical protein
MSGLASLHRELERWEEDLARYEEEPVADEWTQRDRLLVTAQRTMTAYRGRILPRLKAEHDLALPPISDDAALAVIAAYDDIVVDELARAVVRLEDLTRELLRTGGSRVALQIRETLAQIRILGAVVLRFGQEVELPGLLRRLTAEQQQELTLAVRSYEAAMSQERTR